MKTTLRFTTILLSSLLLLSSCLKENSGACFGHMITFNVKSGQSLATKSQTADFRTAEDIALVGDNADQFTLTQYVEDNFEDVFAPAGAPATKGYNTTGSNFADKFTEFRMDCFVPSGAEIGDGVTLENATDNVYFSGKTVTRNTSGWSLADSYTWINDTDLTFWAIAPLATAGASYSDVSFAADHKSFTMKYALPAASTTASDAVNQKDLVVACNSKSIKVNTSGNFASSSETGAVDLDFYHALAAIKFDLSAIPSDITVKKICLKNVSSEGTCSVTLSDGVPAFVWSGLNSATAVYSQAYTSSDFTSDILSAGSEKIYMMIPQSFTANTQITIEYEKTGVEGVFCLAAQLKDNNQKNGTNGTGWSAGKMYTYKLTDVSMKLGVSVSDVVDTNVKQNLVITNTSNTDVYVRVLMMGNWLDNGGRIYKAWSEDEGTWNGKNTTDWTKVGNFWYYKKPVEAGMSIPTANELFTTYTAPAQPATGITLSLTIAAQTIPFDESKQNVTEAWGSDAAAVLSTTK